MRPCCITFAVDVPIPRPIGFWLLLLPLALTVVPRGMLHHCVHEAVVHAHADERPTNTGTNCSGHVAERTPDRHQAHVQADCPICDVHILVGMPGTVLTELVAEAVASPSAATLVAGLHEVQRQVLGARGPPTRI